MKEERHGGYWIKASLRVNNNIYDEKKREIVLVEIGLTC